MLDTAQEKSTCKSRENSGLEKDALRSSSGRFLDEDDAALGTKCTVNPERRINA